MSRKVIFDTESPWYMSMQKKFQVSARIPFTVNNTIKFLAKYHKVSISKVVQQILVLWVEDNKERLMAALENNTNE